MKNIHRACHASTPTERRGVERVLLKYFSRVDGVWCNPRADKEIKKQQQISENAKEKADKRWKVNMPGHMPGQCKPTTSNQQPAKLAEVDEICRDEILPSGWHDAAERRGIPDAQIYQSWRKFKDTASHPYRLKNWLGWVARERVNGSASARS